MYQHIIPIFSLLASFVVICFGHGLQGVLLPTRATLEQFSDFTTGLMMSAYYVGFILGTLLCPRLISRVGHIRVFAAAAAVASSMILAQALIIHPVAWVLLRCIYGLAMVHMYTVMESWLNSIVTSESRGRILSIYMISNFVGISLGQMLFFMRPAEGFDLFAISAMLISLSLLPLILSRISQPVEVTSPEAFGLKRLFALSPLGVVGALAAGLIGSAYWGLTTVYVFKAGYSYEHIAWFMSASLLGGLATQWPLGLMSDRVGRRVVIVIACGMMLFSAFGLTVMAGWKDQAAMFGTFPLIALGILLGAGLHPLYSLCIAHTNDFVPGQQFVRASTGLQFVQSAGAMAGPLLAGAAMQAGGYGMLFGYVAVISLLLLLYTLRRMVSGHTPYMLKPFRIFVRLGMVALRMDPRGERDKPNFPSA